MAQVAAISQQIWDMKYRLKSLDGVALDKTIEDSWQRVALALAEAEAPAAREKWTETFAEALADFKFLPAGRILAGAGAKRTVTLFNCFVMGTIPDDMGGIFAHLREAALTMQQGGGIGYDFSTLRPKGAPVKGVGADASGPLTFMDVWDAMCRTIMSAGHRRGAMMATLRCDHPDIEAFIDAKQTAGRLRMFNLSVLVTDAFMAAVKDDAPWELKFGGTTYRVVQARELWDRIMRATYAYAEPGVIFIDRINQKNNLRYCESISATNPCVTGEAWVQTVDGPRQVMTLIGRPFTALVNGRPYRSGEAGFFSTGIKPVFRLATEAGPSLRLTADHPVQRVRAASRYRLETEWTKAGDLCPGDEVVLADQRDCAVWAGAHGRDEGYLLGLLVGDGTLKADKAVLSVWPGAQAVNGGYARPGTEGIMADAEQAARKLARGGDFAGWMAVPGRGERRLSLAALGELAASLDLAPGDKAITPALERCSSDFYRGFLRGLFDADGSVQGSQEKGVSIRLSQSDLPRLEAVQRMLQRLGIVSQIYRERRPAGPRLLPDAARQAALYECAADHELVVSGENIQRYGDLIGFSDTEKAAKLARSLGGYKRRHNRERFVARVASLEPVGAEEVFDVQIPGINAFDANGFIVHNCGEQPLPPYGACLLGSINLTTLIQEPFTAEAHLDLTALDRLVRVSVRMMDNTIDVSNFPLEAQAAEARNKRRIGLGVTGLADALIMCEARYGGPKAIKLTDEWLRAISRAAYLASTELAVEKGAFPLFEREKFLASETVQSLDKDVQAAIARHGIRNALLTSIAPTGTISLFADNVSSGLEPVFSFKYTRHVLMPDGTRQAEEVTDFAYRLFHRLKGEDAALPDYFVDAQSLSPHDHVVMQATVQKHIDSSISKTINCPVDLSFEEFKSVYTEAYELGCKGCTTYRPNDVTGSVLEVKKEAPKPQAELPLVTHKVTPQSEAVRLDAPKPQDVYEAGGVVYMTQPLDRPEALPGATYKVRWPESDHAIYITINDVIQDGRRRPFEVFINSKNMEHYAWTVGLTRMISAVFRRGGDISFVVEELKAVFDPRGGSWVGGRYVPSLLAAIGEVIERHLIAIGFLPDPAQDRAEIERMVARKVANLADGQGNGDAGGRKLPHCPKCNSPSIIRQEGCDLCTSCGYSKCG
ncbi:LAGLIDADG family homing endonuclease [Dongia sp.]|uniref:LAGLIDADG family homing endonuclease n=1 Tax=Dongia sp. TaxID=1977262 RepID=UPI0035B3BE45